MLGKVIDTFFENCKVLFEIGVVQRFSRSHLWSAAGPGNVIDNSVGDRNLSGKLFITQVLSDHVLVSTIEQHRTVGMSYKATMSSRRRLSCLILLSGERTGVTHISYRTASWR